MLFVVNDQDYFFSHRLPIALAIKEKGFEVHVACHAGTWVDSRFEQFGLIFQKLPFCRGGLNPFNELKTILALVRLFKRLQPTLIHLVAMKPVLYGGVAAHFARVPAIVSAVTGLGSIFVDKISRKSAFIRRIIVFLLKISFHHNNMRVIFQNEDDLRFMVDSKRLSSDKARLIKGSGVDLSEYKMVTESSEHPPVVAMASRLLRDKGVFEFVAAIRILRNREIQARFWLIGSPDDQNPSSISFDDVSNWENEAIIEYLGFRNDIPDLFSKAHIVVLPSYREGMPKCLLEAAACGRAIVTTNVAGCRDTIEPGRTGILINPFDSIALADALETLIIDSNLRRSMGIAGRSLAEKEFKIEKIVDAHLHIYDELINLAGKI